MALHTTRHNTTQQGGESKKINNKSQSIKRHVARCTSERARNSFHPAPNIISRRLDWITLFLLHCSVCHMAASLPSHRSLIVYESILRQSAHCHNRKRLPTSSVTSLVSASPCSHLSTLPPSFLPPFSFTNKLMRPTQLRRKETTI